ncbi:unnamed protein product [Amoebophrya sp. A120]|nr:unnamed protein product [Amoebophrya sp. A120]|eukprot:GSA120T00002356001.1
MPKYSDFNRDQMTEGGKKGLERFRLASTTVSRMAVKTNYVVKDFVEYRDMYRAASKRKNQQRAGFTRHVTGIVEGVKDFHESDDEEEIARRVDKKVRHVDQVDRKKGELDFVRAAKQDMADDSKLQEILELKRQEAWKAKPWNQKLSDGLLDAFENFRVEILGLKRRREKYSVKEKLEAEQEWQLLRVRKRRSVLTAYDERDQEDSDAEQFGRGTDETERRKETLKADKLLEERLAAEKRRRDQIMNVGGGTGNRDGSAMAIGLDLDAEIDDEEGKGKKKSTNLASRMETKTAPYKPMEESLHEYSERLNQATENFLRLEVKRFTGFVKTEGGDTNDLLRLVRELIEKPAVVEKLVGLKDRERTLDDIVGAVERGKFTGFGCGANKWILMTPKPRGSAVKIESLLGTSAAKKEATPGIEKKRSLLQKSASVSFANSQQADAAEGVQWGEELITGIISEIISIKDPLEIALLERRRNMFLLQLPYYRKYYSLDTLARTVTEIRVATLQQERLYTPEQTEILRAKELAKRFQTSGGKIPDVAYLYPAGLRSGLIFALYKDYVLQCLERLNLIRQRLDNELAEDAEDRLEEIEAVPGNTDEDANSEIVRQQLLLNPGMKFAGMEKYDTRKKKIEEEDEEDEEPTTLPGKAKAFVGKAGKMAVVGLVKLVKGGKERMKKALDVNDEDEDDGPMVLPDAVLQQEDLGGDEMQKAVDRMLAAARKERRERQQQTAAAKKEAQRGFPREERLAVANELVSWDAITVGIEFVISQIRLRISDGKLIDRELERELAIMEVWSNALSEHLAESRKNAMHLKREKEVQRKKRVLEEEKKKKQRKADLQAALASGKMDQMEKEYEESVDKMMETFRLEVKARGVTGRVGQELEVEAPSSPADAAAAENEKDATSLRERMTQEQQRQQALLDKKKKLESLAQMRLKVKQASRWGKVRAAMNLGSGNFKKQQAPGQPVELAPAQKSWAKLRGAVRLGAALRNPEKLGDDIDPSVFSSYASQASSAGNEKEDKDTDSSASSTSNRDENKGEQKRSLFAAPSRSWSVLRTAVKLGTATRNKEGSHTAETAPDSSQIAPEGAVEVNEVLREIVSEDEKREREDADQHSHQPEMNDAPRSVAEQEHSVDTAALVAATEAGSPEGQGEELQNGDAADGAAAALVEQKDPHPATDPDSVSQANLAADGGQDATAVENVGAPAAHHLGESDTVGGQEEMTNTPVAPGPAGDDAKLRLQVPVSPALDLDSSADELEALIAGTGPSPGPPAKKARRRPKKQAVAFDVEDGQQDQDVASEGSESEEDGAHPAGEEDASSSGSSTIADGTSSKEDLGTQSLVPAAGGPKPRGWVERHARKAQGTIAALSYCTGYRSGRLVRRAGVKAKRILTFRTVRKIRRSAPVVANKVGGHLRDFFLPESIRNDIKEQVLMGRRFQLLRDYAICPYNVAEYLDRAYVKFRVPGQKRNITSNFPLPDQRFICFEFQCFDMIPDFSLVQVGFALKPSYGSKLPGEFQTSLGYNNLGWVHKFDEDDYTGHPARAFTNKPFYEEDIVTCLIDRKVGMVNFYVNRDPVFAKFQFFKALHLASRDPCYVCIGVKEAATIRVDFGGYGYSPVTNAVIWREERMRNCGLHWSTCMFGEYSDDREPVDVVGLRLNYFLSQDFLQRQKQQKLEEEKMVTTEEFELVRSCAKTLSEEMVLQGRAGDEKQQEKMRAAKEEAHIYKRKVMRAQTPEEAQMRQAFLMRMSYMLPQRDVTNQVGTAMGIIAERGTSFRELVEQQMADTGELDRLYTPRNEDELEESEEEAPEPVSPTQSEQSPVNKSGSEGGREDGETDEELLSPEEVMGRSESKEAEALLEIEMAREAAEKAALPGGGKKPKKHLSPALDREETERRMEVAYGFKLVYASDYYRPKKTRCRVGKCGCEKFERDKDLEDQEICANCGHRERCHRSVRELSRPQTAENDQYAAKNVPLDIFDYLSGRSQRVYRWRSYSLGTEVDRMMTADMKRQGFHKQKEFMIGRKYEIDPMILAMKRNYYNVDNGMILANDSFTDATVMARPWTHGGFRGERAAQWFVEETERRKKRELERLRKEREKRMKRKQKRGKGARGGAGEKDDVKPPKAGGGKKLDPMGVTPPAGFGSLFASAIPEDSVMGGEDICPPATTKLEEGEYEGKTLADLEFARMPGDAAAGDEGASPQKAGNFKDDDDGANSSGKSGKSQTVKSRSATKDGEESSDDSGKDGDDTDEDKPVVPATPSTASTGAKRWAALRGAAKFGGALKKLSTGGAPASAGKQL